MRSFRGGYIERFPITHGVLQSVRLLGEYKGRQDLFNSQIPQALETLRLAAVVHSTESSNRIEGIVASTGRVQEIVMRRAEPRDRPEQEIAGYRDVLNTIHARQAELHPSASLVLELHRDLLRYTPRGGGNWKSTDNAIAEVRPDGTRVVRFRPVPAHRTRFYMEALHTELDARWETGEVDQLLLIAAYVLDFLCIHPFSDGNGRMARLLTLLLLYRAGYMVGRYISLEQLVERTREPYYDALYRSSQGWHYASHDLLPWLEYFLGILTAAYREFEARVGGYAGARGVKGRAVEEAIHRLPATFRIADVASMCPHVSRDMIRAVLNGLKRDGIIYVQGAGRGAVWRKRGNEG